MEVAFIDELLDGLATSEDPDERDEFVVALRNLCEETLQRLSSAESEAS